MERLIGAISLTVLLVGLSAVAQVQPPPEGSLSKLISPTSKTLLTLDKSPADPPLSRAEFAQLLVQAFRLRPASQGSQAQAGDVPASHWAHSDVQIVLSRGIMSRDRQGNFRPHESVPRTEALAILAKAQGKKPLPESTVKAILKRYPDSIQIPTADRSAIALSLQAGILPLDSGRIAPHTPMTRNTMVRALSLYKGGNKK
ncbi:MAG: S-layer homology domain-containing protein [Leptolyngbyaceae cyanobacterium CSU_1_4]|nr:S-layer homology domain-containing protein [Leptolyngbyaceae cyanobacterium CSU_1_4]